jgi:aspartate-semialdehyde dehydrogenase
MDKDVPLIVPEVNPEAIAGYKKSNIIANPNCSTIQMVVALKPLHDIAKIKRIVVATYQAVSGAGKEAMDELYNSTKKVYENQNVEPTKFSRRIAFNVIPQIDVFLENGYTKEEMKMILETKKIMEDDRIQVTATTVRIPVMGGHSEAINIEFENDYDMATLKNILANSPGIVLQDDPANLIYPMPLTANDKDEVFVGRLRRDESQANTLNCWVVSDNLRKGAATNAVQIAEYLMKNNLLNA